MVLRNVSSSYQTSLWSSGMEVAKSTTSSWPGAADRKIQKFRYPDLILHNNRFYMISLKIRIRFECWIVSQDLRWWFLFYDDLQQLFCMQQFYSTWQNTTLYNNPNARMDGAQQIQSVGIVIYILTYYNQFEYPLH
jgi:hypothetical protein